MTMSASRRRFLRQTSAALCAGAGAALMPGLGLVGQALAASRGGLPGYKALVCIYLAGGNDSFNLLVPRDSIGPGSRYSSYRDSRGGVYNANSNPFGLALDFNALIDLGTPPGQGFAYGVHPQAGDYVLTRNGQNYNHPGLASLFTQQKLAFVANVGPLVQPTSLTDFNNGAPIPPQLYSHSDQELQWNLGTTSAAVQRGWGGRSMDLIDPGGLPTLSPCISLAGNTRYQVGSSVFPFQMSPSTGVTQLSNFSGGFNFGDQRRAALDDLLAQTSPHLLTQEYRAVLSRSRALGALLQTALSSSAGRITTAYDYVGGTPPNPVGNFYPNANVRVLGTDYSNPLLDQLRMVARMIKVSRDPTAGVDQSRQIYYVRLDGFDTHGDQMDRHPLLIGRLTQAIGWFWQAMGEINAQNDVSVFTMSDFGRTLSSNGDGTDHAWGGVQLAVGGAVLGGQIYGRYPLLVANSNNNALQDWSFSRGQYIPTTASDQMAATLARWLGVGASDLATVFPNLANFSGPLAFLPA